MLLNAGGFFRSQRAGLQQDRIRNRDFADVVDHAGAAQSFDLIFGEGEAFAEARGHFREAFAMAASVGVAGLNAVGQAEQHGFGVFQFVGDLFQTQQRASARQQFVQVDGLAQKIVGAGIDSLDAIFGGGEASDQHDGREAGFRGSFDAAADFEAVHARHHDVEQDQVGAEGGAFRYGGAAVGSVPDFETFAAQEEFQRGAGAHFVVNN